MDFTKPRVALYYWVIPQTGYRNDGPPLFLNYNMRKILEGVDPMKNPDVMSNDKGNVVHLWPTRKDTKSHGKFDLHILVDHGEDALPVEQDFDYPHPNAYWVSDAHIGYDYRFKTAKKFDFVFCCQRKEMEQFEKDGIPKEKLFYLPHTVEPDCYRPFPILERWDWAFIGHLNSNHRIDLMDRMCKEFPNYYLGWRNPSVTGHNVLEDVAYKFSQARIIVSDSVKEDINMRTFEALACKRLLITKWIPTLEELLQDGKHLVTYKSIDEAVDKVRFYLAHPEERNRIAEAGYNEVLAKHTYRHRALEILKICLNYVPEKSVQEVVNAH